jgi:molybdate transport system substrate-binding protein
MIERPLHLICSMATREVLRELALRYQTATAKPVTIEAAGGIDVATRVERGDALEVVVLAANVIDRLIAQGKLLEGSRVDLVRSAVAVAVRAGAPKPGIGSEEAVKRAVLDAKALAYSTGPSGTHLERTFERWGILERIRARIIVPPPGVPVASLIAAGTAELGFQQLSELMNVPGVEVIGALPPSIQTITVFSGAIAANCSRPDEARALLSFLASQAVSDAKRRHGMEPA